MASSGFSDMRFNLEDIPKGKTVLEHFTELAAHEELQQDVIGLDNDKCIRYAILLVDKNSPITSIGDWDKMQEKALLLAGFTKRADGKWPRNLIKLIQGQNEKVNDIINCLFVIYNDHTYELWYTQKLNYHRILSALRKPPNVDDSDKLMREAQTRARIQSELKSMANDLKRLEAAMFPNPHLKQIVENETAHKMRNYPEELATTGNLI